MNERASTILLVIIAIILFSIILTGLTLLILYKNGIIQISSNVTSEKDISGQMEITETDLNTNNLNPINTNSKNKEPENVNREDGLSTKEFWTLYNYYVKYYGYPLRLADVNNTFLLKGWLYYYYEISNGITLTYSPKGTDASYLSLDLLEDYDEETFIKALKLWITILDGEDSWLLYDLKDTLKSFIRDGYASGRNFVFEVSNTSTKIHILAKRREESNNTEHDDKEYDNNEYNETVISSYD